MTNVRRTSTIIDDTTGHTPGWATIPYTMIPGIMAVTANIAPMTYTPDSLANNIALTGMGSDSIRSLSFA